MRTMTTTCALTAVLAVGACTAGAGESAPASPTSAASEAADVTARSEGTRVPPGRYRMPFEGLDTEIARAELDVPKGFAVYNESVLWADDDRPARGLLLWTVTGVSAAPCRRDVPLTFDDPGPSVEDLATALHRQPHRRGPAPTPVTLAGYDGLYLELRLPRRLNPDECEGGFYEAWQAIDPDTHGSEGRYQYGPGFVDRIWILDAHGQRLVVNATYNPKITARDASALDAMVASITITTG